MNQKIINSKLRKLEGANKFIMERKDLNSKFLPISLVEKSQNSKEALNLAIL